MNLPEVTHPRPVVLQGDARNLILPDTSVDLICTSPPYWSMRSYRDNGEHYTGQIGAEDSPQEFIDNLLECTREWSRVLKPEGSLWVNLGDKYAGGGQGGNVGGNLSGGPHLNRTTKAARVVPGGFRAKSLMGLPWRYAIGCIDDLGLILRAEVIWSKPSPLPESVRDRVRRSHEQWFHLVKQPKYFAGVDEIRQPYASETAARYAAGYKSKRAAGELGLSDRGLFNGQPQTASPLGKLPGSVWEIASQPLRVPAELNVDHFAAFPMEFPRRIILGWSPSGICTECGEGRRPVASGPQLVEDRGGRWQGATSAGESRKVNAASSLGRIQTRTITGYACACPEPTAHTEPSVVLDPFGGTGTTALVASVLGRRGISVDLSADYGHLAQWRTTDPKQRVRAATVPKPRRSPEETA